MDVPPDEPAHDGAQLAVGGAGDDEPGLGSRQHLVDLGVGSSRNEFGPAQQIAQRENGSSGAFVE